MKNPDAKFESVDYPVLQVTVTTKIFSRQTSYSHHDMYVGFGLRRACRKLKSCSGYNIDLNAEQFANVTHLCSTYHTECHWTNGIACWLSACGYLNGLRRIRASDVRLDHFALEVLGLLQRVFAYAAQRRSKPIQAGVPMLTVTRSTIPRRIRIFSTRSRAYVNLIILLLLRYPRYTTL
jgi:hypothetical protein